MNSTPRTPEPDWPPGPEEQKRILRERARALARPPAAAPVQGVESEILEFFLAGEKYGVETSFVREVLPLKGLTFLPGAPSFLVGIIHLHGRIVSVMDIKKLFDLPDKGITDLNRVVILYSEAMEFGILADGIGEIRQAPLSGLESSLPTLTGVRQDYLQGITADRLVVLDAAKLLGDEKLVVNQKIEA
jgi:purine-binding chemotaxis protein CheW